MRVLALLPDNLKKPAGGIVPHFLGLQRHVAADYHVLDFADARVCTALAPGKTVRSDMLFQRQLCFLREYIRNPVEVDLVHAFDWSTSLAGLAIADALDVPCVVTLQLSLAHCVRAGYYADPDMFMPLVVAETDAMQQADAVIHVSQEYLQMFGMLNPNNHYIPNGIDLDGWEPTATYPLPGDPAKFKLGYLGRFAEIKNIPALLAAELPENCELYLVGPKQGGDPALLDIVREHCAEQPRKHYLGPLFGQEKINWLHSLDALIVPSTHEPFGIVCLEALVCGIKLLSSFQSGMGYFLHDDVALNCGTTAESIAAAVQQAPSWEPDRAAVRELLERYSNRTMAELTLRAYQSAVLARRARKQALADYQAAST